jgi:hypothetical protein
LLVTEAIIHDAKTQLSACESHLGDETPQSEIPIKGGKKIEKSQMEKLKIQKKKKVKIKVINQSIQN